MDDTTIANMALAAIGTRSSIANLSEDSPEAAAVQLWYATTRDSLLRAYPWNWARRQVVLALYKSAQGTAENPNGTLPQPAQPWRYEYSWPTDCLNARYILPLWHNNGTVPSPPLTTGQQPMLRPSITPPIKFLVAGDRDADGNAIKVILTNQNIAQLVYTGQIADPNIWDQNFIDAMIGRLAPRISPGLTGDKTLTRMAIETGQMAERAAEAQNGDEQTGRNMWTPDWIEARGFIDTANDESELYVGMSPQDIT